MANHGVYVSQVATSVSTPAVADVGIPFVIGTAPVQSANSPASLNTPILCTSWDDAVEALGYSEDWGNYTLCEFMYSHFKLYACQPVVFCNVLDASSMSESVSAADMDVSDYKVKLPVSAINDATLVVKASSSASSDYVLDTDYATYYDGEHLIIEVMADGDCYSATSLNVAYKQVTPSSVSTTEIATGVECIELCMSTVGTMPDLICAPGYSGEATIAAVMATKAANINGMFKAKALIDIPCDSTGATSYTDAVTAKDTLATTSEDQILCWPMLAYGDYKFHMSTQLAGVMAQVDGESCTPYASPSNHSIQCDSMILEDGALVVQTVAQANVLNSNGIVTALNFMGSWVAWGNFTACYPDSTEVKDYFIPVSRMFGWVGNTLVKTFWSQIDTPMSRRLIDSIMDSANIWINGLTGSGYLLGGRVEYWDTDNSISDLMAGVIKFRIYLTPPSPAQEIEFVLEYDASYVSDALS